MRLRDILRETAEAVVIRPAGCRAANDVPASWTRPGHFYRGMSQAEYEATVAAGHGLRSDGRYSARHEGTCFGEDAETAESYANSGRTDPRTTGLPTYVVEIEAEGSGLRRDRDGYWKGPSVPASCIDRIWRCQAQDDRITAVRIK